MALLAAAVARLEHTVERYVVISYVWRQKLHFLDMFLCIYHLPPRCLCCPMLVLMHFASLIAWRQTH